MNDNIRNMSDFANQCQEVHRWLDEDRSRTTVQALDWLPKWYADDVAMKIIESVEKNRASHLRKIDGSKSKKNGNQQEMDLDETEQTRLRSGKKAKVFQCVYPDGGVIKFQYFPPDSQNEELDALRCELDALRTEIEPLRVFMTMWGNLDLLPDFQKQFIRRTYLGINGLN